MIVSCLVAAVILNVRKPAAVRRFPEPQNSDLANFATLLALCLEAGMTLRAALVWIRPYAHPALATEAASLVRMATADGLVAALRDAGGSSGPFFSTLARAVETGARLGPMLDAYQERLAAQEHAAAEVRLQRLPVKLVFPLALLMLPGLVLMISGPALIQIFGRFT